MIPYRVLNGLDEYGRDRLGSGIEDRFLDGVCRGRRKFLAPEPWPQMWIGFKGARHAREQHRAECITRLARRP